MKSVFLRKRSKINLSDINLSHAVAAYRAAFPGKFYPLVLSKTDGELTLARIYNKGEDGEDDKLIPVVKFHSDYAWSPGDTPEQFIANVKYNQELVRFGYNVKCFN